MFRNKHEFIFFGMRRGGQHAVINWFAAHFERVYFMNNIDNFGKPRVYKDNTGVYAPKQFVDPMTVEDFWGSQKDVLFQSYEDKPIDKLDFDSNTAVVGESRRRTCVLIIRDIYNMMASRIRMCSGIFEITEQTVELWKQHAKEAVGDTSFLPNLIVVNYNNWFRSPEYRRRIEVIAGLPVSDDGLRIVCGVGSSFNGKEYHNRADEMRVNNRWVILEGRPKYLDMVRKPEIWELSGRLFCHRQTIFKPR